MTPQPFSGYRSELRSSIAVPDGAAVLIRGVYQLSYLAAGLFAVRSE
jgi:hypothetical protein